MPKADWGSGASGAASGASTGAVLGGPPGAVIGGVAGGLAGLFGGGKKKKRKKLSTMDKEQQALYAQEHEGIMGKGPLADLYNYNPEQANKVFDETIGRQAERKFKEDIIPKITGQFRSNNLQNSSYHGEGLARAGRDVQESLNAERSKYLFGLENEARGAKRNAIQNIQGRSTFAYDKQAPSGGGIEGILNSISPESIEGFKDMLIKYAPGGV
jgi:hypothetical protein